MAWSVKLVTSTTLDRMAGYLFLGQQEGHHIHQRNKSLWYIDIQVLVSRKQKSHIPSFHPVQLPFPSIYAKFPFTPSLRSFLAKCSSVLFPCCNDQIAPFPEHARWNVHMCQHDHPGTHYPGGVPVRRSCK